MSRRQHPLVIGHRGASGYRPEHSRAAYELAFALGADAVEPDIVASSDGVLVLRHENEISETTDVASRQEFASRRTTKTIDGVVREGWFTEDFTWAELSSLRARERLPGIRGESSTYDGMFPILRLSELMEIIDAQDARDARDGPAVMVAEIKHPTYFDSIGLPLDELFAAEVAGWATADNLVVESFEQSVLGRIRDRGVPGKVVFLAELSGAPVDVPGRAYSEYLATEGLARLADDVAGVSVQKALLLADGSFVDRAHEAGLEVYTWTLRAENRFLAHRFRRGDVASEFGRWRDEFGAIISTGVDGVFADQPDLVREALAG